MMPDSSAQPFLNLQKQQPKPTSGTFSGFGPAWAAGTIVGGGPFAVFLTTSVMRTGVPEFAFLALSPIVVAAFLSLAGMLTVALSASAFLRSRGAETRSAYCWIGIFGGAVLPALVVIIGFGVPAIDEALAIFCASGAVAGLAAGFVWGNYRMRALKREDAAQSAAPNPIHELLH
ncbi:hypothetical protein N8940_02465 [Sphingomonadaceae bacterium]|nr:hypothetical protein [Sphingomonadaceae bacterium]